MVTYDAIACAYIVAGIGLMIYLIVAIVRRRKRNQVLLDYHK